MATTDSTQLDAFEAFYKDVRVRLLLQTWALTGDLPAAQKAVRDSLVIAWHHWRKVQRLDPEPHGAGTGEREDWVRPIVWAHALRRHSVPHLPRNRNIDPGIRATLAAIADLPLIQRKVLLLTHLTTNPLDAVAREVGITEARAEQELIAAMSSLTVALGLPSPDAILGLFEPMAAAVEGVHWPRPTIMARAGTTRRRLHALIGAAVVVAAFVGSGYAVTGSGNGHDLVKPRLDDLAWLHAEKASAKAVPYPLTVATLLSPEQVAGSVALPLTWTTTMTSDDRQTSGPSLPCQQSNYADKNARAALVRTFTGDVKEATAGQETEASATVAAAKGAYATAVKWYGGCRDSRVQLLGTYAVAGIGDQATLVELRNWTSPTRSVAVGVARSGVLTTTVALTLPAAKWPLAADLAVPMLANAVNGICHLPEGGGCATSDATRTTTAPVPTGSNPALLSELDLPPVSGVSQPWVGTDPVRATTNVAATHCDQTSFMGAGITHALTKSFVIPTATALPPQFGLTETVGAFSCTDAASGFVSQVRNRLAACEKTELGSNVDKLSTATTANGDLTIWRVRIEVSSNSSVTYLMAIMRYGTKVAQVGFVPSGSVTMDDKAFTALAKRAQQRLAKLP